MEIIHSFRQWSARKNAKGSVQVLQTNRNGSYFLWEDDPATRYSGLFWYDSENKKMFKIIEHIKLKNSKNSIKIVNNIFMVKKHSRENGETVFMPSESPTLCYALDKPDEIELFLDVKESYDNREWGRGYRMWEEEECLIIKFTKKTDDREDGSSGQEEYSLFLAIAGHNGFTKKLEWVQREYASDKERNSPPFARYVLKACSLKGKRYVFSVAKSKDTAKKEALAILKKSSALQKKEEVYLATLKKQKIVARVLKSLLTKETKMAFLAAISSLDKLIVHGRDAHNVCAGLPWFFQFWPRDSLVSLKALGIIHPKLAKDILTSYLGKVQDDGRIQNISSSSLASADAVGWLFLRAGEIIPNELLLKRAVAAAVEDLSNHHTQGGLIVNGPKETWMDTQYGNDGRQGARIEIQALQLSLLRAAHQITGNGKYALKEQAMKKKVRETFWNGKSLADGLDDPTIRPNIFIAAYAYPDLLSKKEWETCFENALPKLWLRWGGLSTIDVSHPLFKKEHTGQDNASYHNGDSWFWVNNLAAMILQKTNPQKFRIYIEKIVLASTQEILWQGAIGCHAELSSASSLKSQGCLSQAWSSAMFVEMVVELCKE